MAIESGVERGEGGNSTSASGHLVELLTATGTGDREAFTQFYRLTNKRVLHTAAQVIHDHASAEEITQEVYLQAWQMAGRYDASRSSPVGWLMMLTNRRAVDRVRSEVAAGSRDILFGCKEWAGCYDVVEEEVYRRLDKQAVQQSLSTLTLLQREAIALSFYRGHSYSEVAGLLGIPVPTVKARIRGGLRRLADDLAEAEERETPSPPASRPD